jgi:molybdenum cofactor synthesis domain-containing protein
VAIATGAQLPSGADSVLPIEHGCEVDRRLITGDTVTMGQHVRPAGRHAQTGNRLLTAGSIVGAGEIAVLAAFGLGTVAVRALPVATVIGGGDELTPPGEALAPGAIYDSNTPMLESLLGENGCATTARRYGTDDEGAVTELIERAVRESDFVVTCGGVSVGRHDHLPAALESLGALELVRGTTARPGLRFRLFTVSPEAGAPVPVFCLPGNPLSAWFCFQLYVRRFIAASLGIAAPRRLDAVLSTTVARAPERTKLAPGRVELQDTTAVFFPRRCASDAVTEIAGCNAYAIIEPGEIAANKGLRVECELCSG